jgi:arabinogalactan oligomer/maltooligosaccharide transport system permease protein
VAQQPTAATMVDSGKPQGPKPKKGFSVSSRSGSTLGTVVKILMLCVVAGIAAFAAAPLISQKNWIGLVIVAVVTLILFYIYLSPRAIPAKYLVVGTLFLLAFQVIPIIYTMTTAFTNFGDGHRGTKQDAITAIQSSSVQVVEGGTEYQLSLGVAGDSANGPLVFLLSDSNGNVFTGTASGVTPLDKADVTLGSNGKITAAKGYTVLKLGEATARGDEIKALVVPTDNNAAIIAQGVSKAFEGAPTRSYNSACDCVTDSGTKQVWTADANKGVFSSAADGSELAQGWKVGVGFSNFAKVFTDKTIVGHFVAVIIWNFVFAFAVMSLTFALGLAVAFVMNSDKLKGKKIYRSILLLPYAMPGFAMMLVWRDMFNSDYGLINKLFGLDVSWFSNQWAARVAVIIVQLWTGYPYMFLICTGALQAIPTDLVEAAGVDGAKPFYAFRTITFPLLLVAVAPLLIATFAFNFNNFGAIYFISGGGPFSADNPTIGATDLLITYTYRLAFTNPTQYGYAAAVSILIFIIVGAVSFIGFKRTKALEEIN